MSVKRGYRSVSILAISIVLLMMSSGLAVAQQGQQNGVPGEDIDYTREVIEVEQDLENGTISLKLGEASMFVHFGDGRIGMTTVQTKYMGIADIYDDKKGFNQRVGIPTHSVFHQRLVGAGEYVDENSNGLFDVQGQKVVGTFEELQDQQVNHENLLKWVDYNEVSWTLSEWRQSVTGNEVDINFVLSADEVSYDSSHGAVDGMAVDRIAYIFHVTTVEQEIRVDAVPHYEVFEHGEGISGNEIDRTELVANTNVTGHVLNTSWKYDQVVTGWDIATNEDGEQRNDTRLVVLTNLAYGAHMSDKVGQWMKEQFGGILSPKAIAGHGPREMVLGSMQEAGPDMPPLPPPPKDGHNIEGHPLECGLAYVTSNTDVVGSDTEGRATGSASDNASDNDEKSDEDKRRESVHERMKEYHDTSCMQQGEIMPMSSEANAQAIRSGGIHFDDNGANLGRVRWVSNATVDGVETEVLFQVHGARPVVPSDIDDKEGLWAGVRLVGGYNYVIGESVYHDPEFSTDVITIDTQSFGNPFVYGNGNVAKLVSLFFGKLPMVLGVVVLLVVLVGVASSKSRREQAPVPSQQQYVPAGAWTSDDDWSQYQP
ncbi:MAG: hypothetical protein HOE69_05790 [Euryarchaeota archaeon]|jgi:hypothetical protein|nr:hypothetical protein [Euryarchaeota archaeon]